MREFASRLDEGRAFASEHAALAVVPFVSAFLAAGNVARVLAFRGDLHLGIRFPFPAAVVDVWTFASPPPPASGGVTVQVIPVAVAGVALEAVLTAGYLGSVAEAGATGRYDFAANARRYAVPLLGHAVLVFVFDTGSVLFGLLGSRGEAGLVVLALFVPFLVFSYLFYATPYLIVLGDYGLLEALRRSYRYAVEGGAYADFAIRYLATAAAFSVVGTAVTVNLGAAGVLLGAALAAPLGLAFNAAVTSFVRDLEAGATGGQ